MIDFSQLKRFFHLCLTASCTRQGVVIALGITLALTLGTAPALAVDRYVVQFLKALEPVEIPLDAQGNTQTVTPEQLSQGKVLFNKNCENCHLGGTTLLSESQSLSLPALQIANPPLDNINNMVTFLRTPVQGGDGVYQKLSCREVSPEWMSQVQVENLSAFVLRAAQKVPGWGEGKF